MADAALTTDVLVVGAGPAGLALAIELATRGRRVQIVEKADRIGRQPRAKTTNVRSMEHMRRWGLAERIRTLSPLGADHANRIVFATGLFGRTITTIENAFYADRVSSPDFAEAAQWIPQYVIEGVLRDHAIGLPGCALALGTELISFVEDDEGVTAECVRAHGGSTLSVRARFVVGADGARSTVRERLGIAMEGAGRIGNFLTVIVRAPGLQQRLALPDALMYWIINRVSPGILGPMDRDDTWFLGTQLPPDTRAAPGPEEARSLAARMLGGGVEFEVLATDLWSALQLQAKSYATRHVFLAGDACHLHPPFGGYGMNLGIADAVDLGWKLAAVLEGWGGTALLDSYEIERRPVHERVVAESVENMGSLVERFFDEHIDADGAQGDAARAAAARTVQEIKDREFHSLGLVIGYDYAGSPIIVADGSGTPERSVATYTPSAQPGRRAPHAWLADGSSLFDHFGPGFTLLRLALGGADEIGHLEAAASARGIPLALRDLSDSDLAALYGARFALIRPDQHVAWRGDTMDDADALLARVAGYTPTSEGKPRLPDQVKLAI